jgi:long-chain acyl-CoA synthetase
MKRVFELIDRLVNEFQKEVVFAGKKKGKWIHYSALDYQKNANAVSYRLLQWGIQKDAKILSMSTNCPEWNFMDMGIQQCGAIHVPVFPTIGEQDLSKIIRECEVELAFASNNYFYQKLKNIQKAVPSLKKIITFDYIEKEENIHQSIALGLENPAPETLTQIKEAIDENDVATIIYTSGTTTEPKGVMLTHRNLVSNFTTVAAIHPMNPEDTALSYLPLCHSYERIMTYKYQYQGLSVYYAESVETLLNNIQEVQPHTFSSVPLLLEKIYSGFASQMEKLSGKEREIYQMALDIASEFDPSKALSKEDEEKYNTADAYVFSKWRAALGGNIKMLVSGASALQAHIIRAFMAAKIIIYEGYGGTELSPVSSWNRWGKIKIGTVGTPIPGCESKIAPDGEILCKGPNVMKGYFKKPELTAEVIDAEGWYHTGDVGSMDDEGFITITGRKKAIFKTSSGIWVSPESIENTLRRSPFINQVLICGKDKNYLSALILPDRNYILEWAKAKGFKLETKEEILNNKELFLEIEKIIGRYNSDIINETERILRFQIIADDWTIEGGELTPSMKIKRNVLLEKYDSIIKSFY